MRMQWVHPLHSVHVGVHAAAGMHEVLRILREPLCQTVAVLSPEDVPNGARIVAPAGEALLLSAAHLSSTDTIPSKVIRSEACGHTYRKQGHCMEQAAFERCSFVAACRRKHV